ncbi:MAG: tripartite tricarboxylate transporter TctB family protein [Spirochaetota bacterium]
MDMKAHSPIRNKETLLGTILLILSIAVLIAIANFKDTAEGYRAIAPSFFPNLISIVMVVLSLALISEGWRKPPSLIFAPVTDKTNVLRAFALLGLIIGLVLVWEYIGFILSSLLFVLLVQVLLGEKRKVRIILVAVAVTAALYIVFVLLLRVPLPRVFLW